MAVLEALSEEECYLVAILQDLSGLDAAEFSWHAPDHEDECFRAWAFQYSWWRCEDMYQIDQAARAVGKSLGIKSRACVFSFNFPNQEMVITAPELIHLEPLIDLIETQVQDTRLTREMLKKGRTSINHRPFMMRFQNGARIIGRIPQRDGRGAKGIHPIRLEQDECFPAGTLVLTRRGLIDIQDVAVNDEVLTHRNRWRSVTATMTRERETVITRGHGHPGLVSSVHHKFWALRKQLRLVKTADGMRTRAVWTQPDFVPICDLAADGWWCSPTTFPKRNGVRIPSLYDVGRHGNGRRGLDLDRTAASFYWMVGLYLAEGSVGRETPGACNTRVTFSIHQDEAREVGHRLRLLRLEPAGPYPVHGGLGVNMPVNCVPELSEWLTKHFGKGAHRKAISVWALGLPRPHREQLLEGLVFGDGFWDPDARYSPDRWKLTTVSKALAVSTRLLALSLGYSVSIYWDDATDRETVIRGQRIRCDGWYQVVGTRSAYTQGFEYEKRRYTAIREVTPTGRTEVLYDLTVDEDHSFIADGLIVSNSQDYPQRGWTELNATLKRGFVNAQWRAHGVSRGVQGDFYNKTQPDSGWTVHRITAMMRPNWTDEERQEEIRKYGSAEDPDYRRNILGIHGDAMNTLFVLRKLMLCLDVDETSDYNSDQYFHRYIRDTDLDHPDDPERGPTELITRLNLPAVPPVYRTAGYQVWVGMDVGFTSDPSEILIWVEYHPSTEELAVDRAMKRARPAKGLTRIRCIGRIGLRRIPGPLQTEVILHVFDHYQVAGFSMDKTGNGLPLFQGVQARLRAAAAGDRAALQRAADRMKGYNFSEKILVDIEDTKADKTRKERAGTAKEATNADLTTEAGIRRNVLEYSTDVLRDLVDAGRLMLPWDRETPTTSLIDEFHGQTFSFSNSPIDQYGRRRRIFAEGRFHAFDAARMAMLGMVQQHIEEFAATKPTQEPVIDRPMQF